MTTLPAGATVQLMTSSLSRFPMLLPVVLLVVAAGCGLTSRATPDEGAPAYSPDGSWVAFTSDRDGSYALYAAHVGGAARRITDSKDDEGHYVWSPDGSRLVFARFTGEEWPEPTFRGLFLVNRDGTGIKQLTSGDDYWPCWTQGGRTIVFERSDTGAVYSVPAAGGRAQRLAAGGQPACSPDGATVAIVAGRIELLDLATGHRTALPTASGSHEAGAPSWSPDGTRLAFEALRDRIPGDPKPYKFGVNTFWTLEELYVVRADGTGGVRRLTRNAAGDRFPSWLPDGRILFASNRIGVDGWDGGDHVNYYVMSSDRHVQRFQWEPGARAADGSHEYGE